MRISVPTSKICLEDRGKDVRCPNISRGAGRGRPVKIVTAPPTSARGAPDGRTSFCSRDPSRAEARPRERVDGLEVGRPFLYLSEIRRVVTGSQALKASAPFGSTHQSGGPPTLPAEMGRWATRFSGACLSAGPQVVLMQGTQGLHFGKFCSLTQVSTLPPAPRAQLALHPLRPPQHRARSSQSPLPCVHLQTSLWLLEDQDCVLCSHAAPGHSTTLGM